MADGFQKLPPHFPKHMEDGRWHGREVLFATDHGSHLYGTATSSSDRDLYVITTKKGGERNWTKQTVLNGLDLVVTDVGNWLRHCSNGVPQALEAMFAPSPYVDQLSALRAGFRVGSAVWPTYMRTIKSFSYAEDTKRRAHALRLAWNLRQMRGTGRFDPVLHPKQIAYYRELAESHQGDDLYALASVGWR